MYSTNKKRGKCLSINTYKALAHVRKFACLCEYKSNLCDSVVTLLIMFHFNTGNVEYTTIANDDDMSVLQVLPVSSTFCLD